MLNQIQLDNDNLICPKQLLERFPISNFAKQTVTQHRNTIRAILDGKDRRSLIIIPLPIAPDLNIVRQYMRELNIITMQHKPSLKIVWLFNLKEYLLTESLKEEVINTNSSHYFNRFLRLRKLLLELNEVGLAVGVEFIDVYSIHYFVDLISWGVMNTSITESQIHRELASMLPYPIGYYAKNHDNTKIAIEAIYTIKQSHHCLQIDVEGNVNIAKTAGNPGGHLILNSVNLNTLDLVALTSTLQSKQLTPKVIITGDLNDTNSHYLKQHAGTYLAGIMLKHQWTEQIYSSLNSTEFYFNLWRNLAFLLGNLAYHLSVRY